jgi:tRNA-dihydrouridine synthase A
MLGRAAYQTPWLLARVDEVFFGDPARDLSRDAVLAELRAYVERHLAAGGRLNNVTRHILGLYHGQPRARAFRRFLSENATGPTSRVDILDWAIGAMRGFSSEAAEASRV